MSATRIVGLLALLALLPSAPAGAQERGAGMLICYPNAPGTPSSARPVMERFGDYLSQRHGAPVQPSYFNVTAEAQKWLEVKRPRFAILSLALYLQWHDELGLKPVAFSERRGASRERLHLLVAHGSPLKTLEDLKAAGATRPVRIWSSHLDDARFATNVVFERKLLLHTDDTGPVRVVSTPQPLRALRRLKKGQSFNELPVDAVLVDDPTWDGLQRLESFKGVLRVLYSSSELPTPPVLAFPGVSDAEVAKLSGVLCGMRGDPEGQALLKTLLITGFNPPEPQAQALEKVAAAYGEELP